MQPALNTDELQKGRVTLQWSVLEQNDGCIIQLIYVGDPNVQIKAEGVIEGQPQIEKLEFTGRIKSPYEQYESERWGHRQWGHILFMFGILLLFAALALRGIKANNKEGHRSYLEAINSFIESDERRIEWETQQIAVFEKYIAGFEERIKESEEEGIPELAELPKRWIDGYRKDQQKSREKIKEDQSEIEKNVAKKDEAIREHRKNERRINITIIVLILLSALIFIPAIYLTFIAQPVGPPFGF